MGQATGVPSLARNKEKQEVRPHLTPSIPYE